MSSKTVYAFWLLISRHSESPESNNWTFFYSPFNVDVKNVLDFVIWPILDWVIAKLLFDAKNKNQHFWNIIEPKIIVSDEMCWMILETFNRIKTKQGVKGLCKFKLVYMKYNKSVFRLNQIFSLTLEPAKLIRQKVWVTWNSFILFENDFVIKLLPKVSFRLL